MSKFMPGVAAVFSIAALVVIGGCTAGTPSEDSLASPVSVLPPKYLEVREFQSCLEARTVDSYQQWCMPAAKPESCPSESWSQLSQLQGKDRVPSCQ
jgi:hypothetical protein